MPVSNSRKAENAPDTTSEHAGRESGRADDGRPKRAGTGRAAGRQRRTAEAGRPAAGGTRPADSARADQSSKAARPAASGGNNGGGDVRATGTKAGNAGTGRRSGRQKNAAEPSRFRSLDFTGNVRMLSDDDIADLAADQHDRSTAETAPRRPTGPTQPEPPQAASGYLAADSSPPVWSDAAPPWSSWSTSGANAPEITPAEPQRANPQPAALPISGYDELSLPSLRARLRNLGAADLRNLLAHERSHANREDVVTMFERRIVKLEDTAD